MRDRMKPGKNCCKGCSRFSDNFNRADEFIGASATDSTGKWHSAGGPHDNDWAISSSQLSIPTTSTAASAAFPQIEFIPQLPTHVSVTVAITIPADTGKAGILLATGRATSHLSKAEIEVADTGCGFLRLYDLTQGSNTQSLLGWDVPVPDLTVGDKHLLTICFDPDSGVLSAHVVTAAGKTYFNHVKGQQPVTSYTHSQAFLWADESVTGTYYFDDFEVGETKVQTNYYYYYTDNGCPCCGPGDCQVTLDEFDGPSLDCRWSQLSGSHSFPVDGTVVLSNSGDALLWNGSYSGIDQDCLADYSVLAAVRVKSDVAGAEVIVEVDWLDSSNYYYGKLTLSSPATIAIYSSQSGLLASHTLSASVAADGLWNNFYVCLVDGTLTARCAGELVEADVTPFGGDRVAIGSGSVSGDIVFDYVEITHDLYSAACKDCYSADPRPPDPGTGGQGPGSGQGADIIPGCDLPICTGDSPAKIRVKIGGTFIGVPPVGGSAACCDAYRDQIFGSHILTNGALSNGNPALGGTCGSYGSGSRQLCDVSWEGGGAQCPNPGNPTLETLVWLVQIYIAYDGNGDARVYGVVNTEVLTFVSPYAFWTFRSNPIPVDANGQFDCLSALTGPLTLCDINFNASNLGACIDPDSITLEVFNI